MQFEQRYAHVLDVGEIQALALAEIYVSCHCIAHSLHADVQARVLALAYDTLIRPAIVAGLVKLRVSSMIGSGVHVER